MRTFRFDGPRSGRGPVICLSCGRGGGGRGWRGWGLGDRWPRKGGGGNGSSSRSSSRHALCWMLRGLLSWRWAVPGCRSGRCCLALQLLLQHLDCNLPPRRPLLELEIQEHEQPVGVWGRKPLSLGVAEHHDAPPDAFGGHVEDLCHVKLKSCRQLQVQSIQGSLASDPKAFRSAMHILLPLFMRALSRSPRTLPSP